jgi:hypothetical protein
LILSLTPPPPKQKKSWVLDFCCSQIFSHKFSHVLISSQWVFSICSQSFQCVPQYVLLKSTSLCPISFALSSTLVTYIISSPKGRVPILGLSKAWFTFAFVMDQSMMPNTKEKEINLRFPYLINMKHFNSIVPWQIWDPNAEFFMYLNVL